MIPLFSDEGRRALYALAERPVLYAFDFDGTLAPLARDPSTVRLARAVRDGLTDLARRVACAVVSGRSLTDLVSRLDGAVLYVIGNHGIESPIAEPARVREAERICLAWKDTLASQLAAPFKDLGVEVEDKRYSLTVHFRGAAPSPGIHRAVEDLLGRFAPAPRLIAGKSSINVLPPGMGGKGPAVLALMRHLGRSGLFFVADDETDEDVFTLPDGLTMGVCVGKKNDSHAQYYIERQQEIEDVLRCLVDRLNNVPESAPR
jgi:trehalose 6-phosphate phosphatase